MIPIQPSGLGGVQRSGQGSRPSQTQQQKTGQSFESILRQQSQPTKALRMSRHASERLMQRNIKLTNADWSSINQAVDQASIKGIKNSLVIKGDLALLVNVPSKTVMTAVNKDSDQPQVFTNIDGAVVI